MTEDSSLSAHVRYGSQEAVAAALLRMEVACGAAVPVWPPKPLPAGLFISSVRNGWVSLWSPLADTREWFPRLTETLEAPGLLLEVIQDRFAVIEFLRDGNLVGRLELPLAAVEWDHLWARTADSFEEEGVVEPWENEARFGARMDEIAASEEYREDLRRLHEERPEPEAISAFLPPHARVEHAWELLTALDRLVDDGEDAGSGVEEKLENFAGYLGIHDAAWDPAFDMEALAEGDYEEGEGLPEGWREFVVLPVRQLPMLS